jgi:hypothetical protein
MFSQHSVHGEWQALVPDWEILSCILRRLQRGIGISLCWHNNAPLWYTEMLPTFAGVIRGQAMITTFMTGDGFPFRCLDTLCSALLTLPALENVCFDRLDGEGPEEVQALESMIKLLQAPHLRKVQFNSIDFTNTLSKAVAKALAEKSEITDLSFYSCSFPEAGGAVIASALKTNTTIICLDFYCETDNDCFHEGLAATLLSNSTLQNLGLSTLGGTSCSRLLPVFLALQVNTGLKELRIFAIKLSDEKLSAAMRLGLGENSTLESLHLGCIQGHDGTCFWREALSFLRTNTALKTLRMNFQPNVSKSRIDTIRMEVLAMLWENESLETLGMIDNDGRRENYLVFVAAIQPNTTLKSLQLSPQLQHLVGENFCVNEDEIKDLIPVLQRSYGIEDIPGLRHSSADICSIFELK